MAGSMQGQIQGETYFLIWKNKMNYKDCLPSVLLYKGSNVLQSQVKHVPGRKQQVCVQRCEQWLRSKWPTEWLSKESETFKTHFSPCQGSLLSSSFKILQDKLRCICDFIIYSKYVKLKTAYSCKKDYLKENM